MVYLGVVTAAVRALVESLGCLLAPGVVAGTVQPLPLQLYEGYPDLQL